MVTLVTRVYSLLCWCDDVEWDEEEFRNKYIYYRLKYNSICELQMIKSKIIISFFNNYLFTYNIHNIYFFNNSESVFLTNAVNASSDSHWALNDPDNPYVVLAFVYTPVTGSIFAILTCTAPKSLAAKIRFVQELF